MKIGNGHQWSTWMIEEKKMLSIGNKYAGQAYGHCHKWLRRGYIRPSLSTLCSCFLLYFILAMLSLWHILIPGGTLLNSLPMLAGTLLLLYCVNVDPLFQVHSLIRPLLVPCWSFIGIGSISGVIIMWHGLPIYGHCLFVDLIDDPIFDSQLASRAVLVTSNTHCVTTGLVKTQILLELHQDFPLFLCGIQTHWDSISYVTKIYA